MRKNLLLLAVCTLLFLTFESQAQAKKYTMFEHFTQASCGPCAAQNPAFEAIYKDNRANAHHVAYHTQWPGTDPMNDLNPDDVSTMVSLYDVSGVPDMIHDGVSIGGPVSVSQSLIDQAGSAPIRVLVEQTLVGDTMTGVVTIQAVDEKPEGDFALRVMAVEGEVNYASAPGTNGEKDFPNVFRQFILGGEALGMAFVLPENGESITFNFEYAMNSAWAAEEIYTLAYVQNIETSSVLNSGASNDPVYEMFNASEYSFVDAKSTPVQFDGSILSSSDNDVVVSIASDASDDWSYSVYIDSVAVSDGDTVSLLEGNADVVITMDPGSAIGIANIAISVTAVGENAAQRISYTAMNNVTDLVVVSDNASSGGNNVDFGAPFLAGLAAVSTETKASLGHAVLPNAELASALDDVENIYYSIGWSFPALTDDVTAVLVNHLDRGGNLMISGQDVGWDIMSMNSSSNGTPAQRTFFTNYLQTEFVDDGSDANANFIANPDDNVFGDVASTTVDLNVYSAGNTYPDQLNPVGPHANSIFSYSSSKSAGVKSNNGAFKTVYLGIGLEQVADDAVANQIFTLTHDWFHGLVSAEYLDAALAELGNAIPNPASDEVKITFGETLQGDVELLMSDVSGQTVLTQPIASEATSVKVNVSTLASGVYFYRLTNGKQMTTAKKLIKK